MKIIARKNNLYDIQQFQHMVSDCDYIGAVGVDVVMTKDQQIVVFTPVIDNVASVVTLQNSTLEQVKSNDIITLRQFFQSYRGRHIEIFINIIPFSDVVPTSENIKQINDLYWNYVEQVVSIVSEFPDIKTYLYSINRRVITYLSQQKKNYKVGIYLSPDDASFLDVDFYLFSPDMLNMNILNQQMNLKKEIVLLMLNCEQTQQVFQFFQQSKMADDGKKTIFDSSFFLTNYPSIVHHVVAYETDTK